MKIDKSFRMALDRAYVSRSDLNKLFVEQRHTIEHLARWALRGNHWGVISDIDDLYQEACIWIVDSMWRWDETVGTPLAEYVVYNVGARLRNVITKEIAKKRCPRKQSISLQKELYKGDNLSTGYLQDRIPSLDPSQEERLAFEEALRCIDNELPYIAKMLLDYMIEEDGNFTAAATKLQKKIRGYENFNSSAFRMQLRRKVIPEIHSVLIEHNLVSGTAKKKIIENFVQRLMLST